MAKRGRLALTASKQPKRLTPQASDTISEVIFYAGQQYIGKPRVIFLDIETSPILGWTWGIWETNVLRVVQNTKILAFSVRVEGEATTHVYTLPDFKGYKPGIVDDFFICEKLWEYLDNADVIIAHNGKQFDLKKIHGRFFKHGMGTPRRYKVIDTLKEARKHLGLDSNKMGDICEFLGIGMKLKTHGVNTWLGCIDGDMKEWRKMAAYNKHDVDLLVEVYKRLLVWILWNETRRKPIKVKTYRIYGN